MVRLKRFLDHVSLSVEEEQNLVLQQAHQDQQDGQSAAAGKGKGKAGFQRKWTAPPPDEKEVARDAVWMGTVHQAKGLEWPVVFVVRFNEEGEGFVGLGKPEISIRYDTEQL